MPEFFLRSQSPPQSIRLIDAKGRSCIYVPITQGSLMMSEPDDREELEGRLAQSLRLAAQSPDDITKNRLNQLARDLESQLKKTNIAHRRPDLSKT